MWTQKKKILVRVAASVREYASENQEIDYGTLVARFGSPKQIASSCVAEMEICELMQGLHIHRKIMYVVLATAVLLVAVWTGVLATAYNDHATNDNGYVVVEVIEGTAVPVEQGGIE